MTTQVRQVSLPSAKKPRWRAAPLLARHLSAVMVLIPARDAGMFCLIPRPVCRYNVLKHIYTDPCRNLLDLHIPEHVWNCSLFRRPQFCS